MKLILTREVAGLGLAGDIVEVADGYGRNFLVPRGAAIAWTKGAEKQIVQIRRLARRARDPRPGHAREIKDDLEKLSVTLGARAGKAGKLFGSVTVGRHRRGGQAGRRSRAGPQADHLPGHIKQLGTHQVTVDLHPDVVATSRSPSPRRSEPGRPRRPRRAALVALWMGAAVSVAGRSGDTATSTRRTPRVNVPTFFLAQGVQTQAQRFRGPRRSASRLSTAPSTGLLQPTTAIPTGLSQGVCTGHIAPGGAES